MLLAIPFPDISPEIFAISVGDFRFALRWYALAYIVGLLAGWWIIVRAMKRTELWPANTPPMAPAQVEGLLTAVILGVIIGGRMGYALFYQPGRIPVRSPVDPAHLGGRHVLPRRADRRDRRRVDLLPPHRCAAAADRRRHGDGGGHRHRAGPGREFHQCRALGPSHRLPWGVIFPGEAAQACPGPVGMTLDGLTAVCARHPSQLYEAASKGC
jgi:phosphatidylglycerol:prolipoprotein diacylglycerol transferase